MIIALANNKGGVAKTTTAVNLAESLASMKKKVLLVDLDGQGSASLSLGVGRGDLSPSMADVLLEDMPIKDAIRENVLESLDLLTGSMELANSDLILADEAGRENKLRGALRPVRKSYDFILLDCPPSLGLISVNALVCADAYIIPVVPHYLALEGLVNLLEAIERIREGIGSKARLLGLLLTIVDYRNRATHEIADIIRGHYKKQVFDTEIRINTRLAEAPSHGKPIFAYSPTSTGAQSYGLFAEELLNRCRNYVSK